MTADLPLRGLRIGQLTAWASRANGGVFGVMVAHARIIAELGGEPVIFALEDPHAKADQAQFFPFEVHHYPVKGPAKIGYAPAMADGLVAANIDLLQLHGVWMYPSRAGMLWAKRTGRPYVISPHGMLDPWITGRGKARKMIARLGYERASWNAARLFHALTQREAQDISNEVGPWAVSEVIPNASPAADPLPAGFEIENPDLSDADGVSDFSWLELDTASHVESRTDQYVAAFRYFSEAGSFTTAYLVRAVSPGSFTLPGATIEDMYRPERRAITAAGTVEVTSTGP